MRRKRSMTCALALAAAGLLLLAGCAGVPWTTFTGHTARPDNRVPLERGGPHPEVWKTRDLALQYTYRLDDQSLDMAGEVVPLGPIVNFPVIRQLDMRVHFLDSDGVVLDTRTLWDPGYLVNVEVVTWTFQHRWTLPPGTWALAFSYDGEVGGGGGRGTDDDVGGSVDWEFWYGP